MSARLVLTRITNIATDLEVYSSVGKPLEVVECIESKMCFIAKKIAAEGQILLLSGTLQIGHSTQAFEATGRIAAVRETADGKFRFEVHLSQYDKNQWKRLLSALNDNQSRADRIFASIRSEE